MPRKHKWQAEKDRKIKERVRRVKRTLHVGQILYLADTDAPYKASEDIVLERARIVEIPRNRCEVIIKMSDGSNREMDIGTADENSLYLATLEQIGKFEYWVFTTEENFWDWRDWEILVVRLNSHGFIFGSIEDYPTKGNLEKCRLLQEILLHENGRFQNLSCAGCVNESQPGKPCAGCVREKALKDLCCL